MLIRSRFVALAALAACVGTCAAANTPDDCKKLRLHGQRAQANACFDSLTSTNDPFLRAEGFWGLEQYNDANAAFRDAAAANGKDANVRVEWGMLLRQRFNNKDAADLFHEALARDPKNARAFLGEAYVSMDGQDNAAAKDEIKKALEIDPKLYEAHNLLAQIALEDSDNDTAIAEADKAIAISPDALQAYAVHAAVEVIGDRSSDSWVGKITAINSGYGDGYALIAHDLELHYRYEDAIAYYRKAIDADPKLWHARSSLGVNLMRIGNEDEAYKQLEMSFTNGQTDAMTSNTLKLLDSNKAFVTFKDATTVLKFRKKEADLLRPYFDTELHRILTTYDQKYKMKLPDPVQVEVYPDHEDFAVRTMGMPGLGALGVTFGEAIAMDSPSGRKPGDFNWGATLWHEMSHVYILTATNHRVPRWFTEGLAVHEEGQRDPEWSNRVTPDILLAIRDHKLLPVAKLDRGFTSPEFPSQVIVSYFQAGNICDFIAQKWGDEKLLGMVHSYTVKKTTSEAIQENLGISAEEFDKQYMATVEKKYGAEAHDFNTWRGLLKGLADAATQKQWELVLQQAPIVIKMYPEYVQDASGYEFLAAAQSEKGDKKAAAETLMAYVKQGGEDPVLLRKLASLEIDLGDKKAAADVLARLNYIYPMDEDVHRQLGNLWFEQKNFDGATREYGAVVALNPLDKAGSQYNLAKAELAAGHKDKAEAAVLDALEAAPGYRPAQTLLLDINSNGGATSTLAADAPPSAPPVGPTPSPTFYGALGLDLLSKKNAVGAIEAYKKELASVPEAQTTENATIIADTYQLAQAYLLSAATTHTDFVNCAFYAARASTFAPEQFKAPMLKTAQYCYAKYHGYLDGFDALQQAAQAHINPPAELKISPTPEPPLLVQQVLRNSDPAGLTLGDKEFILRNGSMKDANGVTDAERVWATMKGKSVTIPDAQVIAATSTELAIAASDDAQSLKTADIAVAIKPSATPIVVGSFVTVTATYDSYTASPFRITMISGEVQPNTKTPAATNRQNTRRNTNTK